MWKNYKTKPQTVQAQQIPTTRLVQTTNGERLANSGDYLVRRGATTEVFTPRQFEQSFVSEQSGSAVDGPSRRARAKVKK